MIREEEGVGIERVSQPRQRLEDLFLEIVEAAQREHVETSGVTDTGGTADFLRHQEGDTLIESLVSDAAAAAPARSVEVVHSDEVVVDEDVLSSLVDAAPEPEARSNEVQQGDKGPEDVDHSVIDDLIGGSPSRDDSERS